MGTEVECLLEGDGRPEVAEALRGIEREFERLEEILSRFRPESELMRLNREGSLHASPDLFRVVELALDARERTGGVFDPTIHDALVTAGYDRTFEELESVRAQVAVLPSAAPSCHGRVWIDPETRLIVLDDGVRLDLGGIAKGDTVDRACELLGSLGPCLVNAGGDVAVSGQLERGPWPVGVDVPAGSLTVGVASGGLATSGRDRRRWLRDGEERHHLIDPSTGSPADTDLVRVTACAGRAAEAEVHAKTLLLVGERAATARADADGIPCVLVTGDERVVLAGGLEP